MPRTNPDLERGGKSLAPKRMRRTDRGPSVAQTLRPGAGSKDDFFADESTLEITPEDEVSASSRGVDT
jgi:hypothetical protein